MTSLFLFNFKCKIVHRRWMPVQNELRILKVLNFGAYERKRLWRLTVKRSFAKMLLCAHHPLPLFHRSFASHGLSLLDNCSRTCLSAPKPFQWQGHAEKYVSRFPTFARTQLHPEVTLSESGNLVSEDTSQSRLVLVDGKALVYRAYYKISSKIFHGTLKKASTEESTENSSWDSTMTTVLTLTEILNLLELQPSHVAVVFDFPGATFRHILFPDYKGHRIATPDTVRQAVRDTKHAVLAMGVKVLEVPGVEADDVIGTLSSQALQAGMKVRIASQDKDFFQLLDPELRLLRFRPKGPGLLSFGPEDFFVKFPNLEVSQFVDMQALVGDVADNIPGVKGIGDVTARKLISEFGTLENLLENRIQITYTRAKNSLLLDKGEALLSKQLLTLKLDVPEFAIGCTLKSLRWREPEDNGKSFSRLINAFGAIVGDSVAAGVLERTFKCWGKLVLDSVEN